MHTNVLGQEQLCYFEDIDKTEVVNFTSGNIKEEETIKSFLINLATN